VPRFFLISISGSPFLFLLTVEFLVYDSSHKLCDGYTFHFCDLLQRRLLRFTEVDVGSIHAMMYTLHQLVGGCKRCF
jgi:hypothetical protein